MRLIPAIIQDASTKEVLMLAYMNQESLKKSIETGTTWFYSRERKKLWNKGEESGHYQNIQKMSYDCDLDCLLIQVEQVGAACHTGEKSCFFRELDPSVFEKLVYFEHPSKGPVLSGLYDVLVQRIRDQEEGSYTVRLHQKGLDEILKKLGEECIEVILSAKHQDRSAVVYEIADLLYHLLVLMVEKEISVEEIEKELAARRKKRSENHKDQGVSNG